MKDFVVKELDRFIEISDSVDSPFKFFEVVETKDKELIRAELWLRTAMISWEGIGDEAVKKKLKDHGFSEAILKETKKLWLAELI
jgi:hypothetical protein